MWTEEYGVKWADDPEVEPCVDEREARRLIDMYPSWEGALVVRKLWNGGWMEVK